MASRAGRWGLGGWGDAVGRARFWSGVCCVGAGAGAAWVDRVIGSGGRLRARFMHVGGQRWKRSPRTSVIACYGDGADASKWPDLREAAASHRRVHRQRKLTIYADRCEGECVGCSKTNAPSVRSISPMKKLTAAALDWRWNRGKYAGMNQGGSTRDPPNPRVLT